MALGTPPPFSVAELESDLATPDADKLRRWADRNVAVAFVRDASNQEVSAMVKSSMQSCYAASPSASCLQTLFADVPLASGHEVIDKTMTLADIARNADVNGFGVYLSDEHSALQLQTKDIARLGVITVLQSPKTEKQAPYRAEAYSFQPIDGEPARPYGSLQYWQEIKQDDDPNYDPAALDSFYVFDDQLDWSKHLFPSLPDNTRALSSLPPQAQAFFNHMRAPLLPVGNDVLAPLQAPKRPYQNSLIGAQNLESFNQLYAIFDRDVVPPASEITLTATTSESLEDGPANTEKWWDIKIDFTMPVGLTVCFDLYSTPASQCKANRGLPDSTGAHNVSQGLRDQIVNHLAWATFERGRNFKVASFDEDLQKLLPGTIINSSGSFQPDYTDGRFPCLARFLCGEHHVPVMVLGQDGRNYICQPTQDISIPAADCPSLIPNRSELIDDESQVMALSSDFDKVAIPTSLIDFPNDWYRGIRLNDQYLRTEFFSAMSVNALLHSYREELEESSRKGSDSVASWLITVAVVIALILFLSAF